ncbi:MAG: serine/threonine protein kinase [Pirellulales bacterium]|nr:serine/threonine protein kinase [Pirellulales bacterium]
METTNHSQSKFCQAAVVSELVTREQLAQAIAEVRADVGPAAGTEVQSDTSGLETSISDEAIGDKLIQLGYLNRWQVGQLQEGRTKFTLGPYRILDSIGRGGMGHVFKGEHRMLGRIEAIKVLPKSKTTPEAIETFQREIRAQARLDHPNLVRVSYADRDGDTYFFVTEYVPGTDLRQLVRRYGRLTMHEAATIISQAAQGIHYAHERGLIHRDVKPGNLLVTPDGLTKVTDLGLAWFLQYEDNLDPNAGKVVGTADYLAPEAIRSPAHIVPSIDIYALGCTLYYAVTGKVLFPGGKTSDKVRRHLHEVPINPRRFNPDLSDMFLDVLAEMIEKDPSQRIATAAEVVQRLRPWTLSSVAIGAKDSFGNTASGSIKKERAEYPDGILDTATDVDSPSQNGEHSSQVSQGTLKASAWCDETQPVAEVEEFSEYSASRLIRNAIRLPQLLILTVAVAVLMVVAVIVAIIMQSK